MGKYLADLNAVAPVRGIVRAGDPADAPISFTLDHVQECWSNGLARAGS
jgi:hypothetical protein